MLYKTVQSEAPKMVDINNNSRRLRKVPTAILCFGANRKVCFNSSTSVLQQVVTATAVCGHHGTPTCLDVGRSLGCPFAHSRGEYTVKSAYIQ